MALTAAASPAGRLTGCAATGVLAAAGVAAVRVAAALLRAAAGGPSESV
ncbi:hypothetical protein [Ancylobacter sp.]